jgi:hypothetical protein
MLLNRWLFTDWGNFSARKLFWIKWKKPICLIVIIKKLIFENNRLMFSILKLTSNYYLIQLVNIFWIEGIIHLDHSTTEDEDIVQSGKYQIIWNDFNFIKIKLKIFFTFFLEFFFYKKIKGVFHLIQKSGKSVEYFFFLGNRKKK